MKTKLKYTNKFHVTQDYGDKLLLIRKFGKVIIGEKETEAPLLVISEAYDLLHSGAVAEDEIPDVTKPVMLSFSLLPELKFVSPKHKEGAQECSSLDEVTIEDIYEYMGGLRFEPSEVVWFESIQDAERHIRSKELNDKISGMGMLSGFVMDMHYNRIGETNWDILNKIMNGK